MKRMVYIWLSLIVLLLGAGFVDAAWSIQNNIWVINALIILILLVLNEIGLYLYRRRMRDIGAWMQHKRPVSRIREQEGQSRLP